MKKEFGKVDGVVRAKRRPYVPVVLSREEFDLVINCLEYPYDLVVKLLYGCGLRLAECMKLRIKEFNWVWLFCNTPLFIAVSPNFIYLLRLFYNFKMATHSRYL